MFDYKVGGPNPAVYTEKRQFGWECDLADHSNSGIDSPSSELFDVHRQFSTAVKWTHIASIMKRNPHPHRMQKTAKTTSSQIIFGSLLAIWLKVPDNVRMYTYKILRAAGSLMYTSSNVMGVQRLPFGIYLKYGPEFHRERHLGEFNALKLVRTRTLIPAPYPIDLILTPTESFMITSQIEGEKVGLCIQECTDEEVSTMAQDLRLYISQLRTLKRPADSECAISNTVGGPCLDYRIDSEPVGPFVDEKAFNEFLMVGALPGLMHKDGHKIVYTHGDLNMRNILMKDGMITGIVDWENAGWFPEYWEFGKCYFSVTIHKMWLKMIDEVVGGSILSFVGRF